jgi:tetratricopeptide (TPR) repeat protein
MKCLFLLALGFLCAVQLIPQLHAQPPRVSAAPRESPQSAAALHRDAEAAFDRGDWQQAIALYRRLLRIQPGAVDARVNLGVAFSHVGHYADAVAQYEDGLKRLPGDPVILLDLALARYKQADFTGAAADLEKVHEAQPDNLQALYLLADCDLRLDRNSDAIALLRPACNAHPQDRALNFALGLALLRAGKSEEGSALMDRIVAAGNTPEVEVLRGASQLAAHDSRNAALTLRKALDENPHLPGGWSLYGRAELDNHVRDEAQSAFLKALNDDPNDFDANLYLAAMLREDGKTDAAGAYLAKALALRPASVEARFQSGMLHLACTQLDKALDDFIWVEKQSSDFEQVHVQLALLYSRLHRANDSQRERALVLQFNEKVREQAVRQPAR